MQLSTNKQEKKLKITIDEKIVKFNEEDKNIVDVTDRAKIGIPAPCYRADRKKGCCNACVVEIDGEQKFACNTKPIDGMKVILNRDDLKAIRKERLLEYEKGVKTGQPCSCSSSSNCC